MPTWAMSGSSRRGVGSREVLMNALLSEGYQRLVGNHLLPFCEGRLKGRKTYEYWREFEANQWLPAEEIAALQWRRLRTLLTHAYETVPYYRAAFDDLGACPEDIQTPEDFARLPVLEKATIREHKDRLVSSKFS